MYFEAEPREVSLADVVRELAARSARVAEVREACAAGTYHVDSEAVAEALLRRWAAASSGATGET